MTSSFDKEFIDQDSIKLSDAKNVLKYGENGIIVNIKASSLKKLYTKHSKNGLFSYNLREHISQKNVDSGIENTIKKFGKLRKNYDKYAIEIDNDMKAYYTKLSYYRYVYREGGR